MNRIEGQMMNNLTRKLGSIANFLEVHLETKTPSMSIIKQLQIF
jgi:hypothetical protein